jgi:hypothetical protein
MKITTCTPLELVTGDIIEKIGATWRVHRILAIAIGNFEGRELLCTPISAVPGLEIVYWREYCDTSLTVWKASEVSP